MMSSSSSGSSGSNGSNGKLLSVYLFCHSLPDTNFIANLKQATLKNEIHSMLIPVHSILIAIHSILIPILSVLIAVHSMLIPIYVVARAVKVLSKYCDDGIQFMS